jgi:hypothetical protein
MTCSSEVALPVYRGEAPSPACSPARLPRRSKTEWSLGWQLVAASLLGVVIGSLAVGGWFGQRVGHPAAASNPNHSGLAMLASLKLNEVCLPSSMSLASSERLRCCTDCHSSGDTGLPPNRRVLSCGQPRNGCNDIPDAVGSRPRLRILARVRKCRRFPASVNSWE